MTALTGRRASPGHALALAVLLGLSALSWVATARFADAEMRIGVLTGSRGSMDEMAGAGAVATLVLFMATWIVMMVAMMFPAFAPVVLTFRRWASGRGRPRSATGAFVAGYLAVWSVIGLAVYLVVVALEDRVAPTGDAVRVGALLLVVAGAYQLTPFKHACLVRCRSPLSILMEHGSLLSNGHSGPFRVGFRHGTYCVGCCWSLMLVLVLLGVMNLAWMGVVAALIFGEKVLARGEALSRVVGVGLVAAGVALAIFPGSLGSVS